VAPYLDLDGRHVAHELAGRAARLKKELVEAVDVVEVLAHESVHVPSVGAAGDDHVVLRPRESGQEGFAGTIRNAPPHVPLVLAGDHVNLVEKRVSGALQQAVELAHVVGDRRGLHRHLGGGQRRNHTDTRLWPRTFSRYEQRRSERIFVPANNVRTQAHLDLLVLDVVVQRREEGLVDVAAAVDTAVVADELGQGHALLLGQVGVVQVRVEHDRRERQDERGVGVREVGALGGLEEHLCERSEC